MASRPLVVRIVGEADFDKAKQAVSGLGKTLGGLALGAGVAAAGGLAAGFGEALNLEKVQDRLAAQLGLTGEAAAAAGQIAGDLYANAYGESLDEVSTAVQSAFAAFPDSPPDVLQDIARDALDMGAAFDGSADQFINLARQLESQGVVDSAQLGLDNLTVAFQQLPAQMQGPLTDAVSEYGTFLDSLGFSTAETFDILTQAAGDGEFALDKTGDALKEFSIRATDLSTSSVDAFNAIGLDAQRMGEQVLAGGDTAKGAFDQIVDGLLGITDPVAQANAAIALFGTPLEDLGVDQIPTFLESLDQTTGSFDDVAGATARMGEELNDNLATRLETLRRKGLVGLAAVARTVVVPVVERMVEVFGRVSAAVGRAVDVARTAFQFLRGDAEAADAYFANLGAGAFGQFFSRVGRIAFEAVKTVRAAFDGLRGLFAGGAGGGLRSAFDGILSALTPLAVAAGDFFAALRGETFEDFNQTAVRAANIFRAIASAYVEVGSVVGRVASVFATAFAVFSADESQRGAFFENLGTPLGRFVSQVARVAARVREIFGQVAGFIVGVFSDAIGVVAGLFSGGGGGGGLRAAIDGILTALTPLVTAVGDFFTVLSTGEGYEDFNQTAVQIAQTVRGLASVLVNDVIPAAVAFGAELVAFGQEVIPKVLPVLREIGETAVVAFGAIVDTVAAVVDVVSAVWARWGDEIVAVTTTVFGAVLDIIGGALDVVLGAIRVVLAIVRGDWSAAWDGIRQVLSGAWDIMKAVVQLALQAINGIFTVGLAGLRVAWTALWNTLKAVVSGAWEAIKGFVRSGATSIVDAIRGLPGRITSAASGMFNGIVDAFRAVLDRIRDLWSGLNLRIPEIDLPGPLPSVGGGGFNLPGIPFFNQGGVVTQPTLGLLAEVPSINRNNPEIVSPKDQMIDALMQALQMAGVGGGAGVQIGQLTVQDGRDFEATLGRMARERMTV